MRHLIYRADDWILPSGNRFIFPHARNRQLNMERHSHDFYEMTFLFEGAVTHTIEDHTFQMYEGEISFISPFQVHQFHKQTSNLDMFTLSVMTDEMEPFLKAYELERLIAGCTPPVRFSMSGTMQHTLSSLFHDLSAVSAERRAIDVKIIIGLTLQELLLASSQADEDWISQLTRKMNIPEYLAEGVPAMIRLSGISHAQLCRNMKKANGMTPQQLIRELRLSYAYEMICSTAISYEEIAFSVGYSSFSHFSATFKERYGITPSALRKTSPQATLL